MKVIGIFKNEGSGKMICKNAAKGPKNNYSVNDNYFGVKTFKKQKEQHTLII